MAGPPKMATEPGQAKRGAVESPSAISAGAAITQRRPLPAWLSAGSLGLIGLVAVAVVAAPAALGLVGKFFFDSAHRPVEALLRTSDGAPDPVTALAWSPSADGPLFVGTQSGQTVKLARDGSLQQEAAPLTELGGPVVRIQATSDSEHFDVVLDLEAANTRDAQVRSFALSVGPNLVGEDRILPVRGLLAVADDFNGTSFVGAVRRPTICTNCDASLSNAPRTGPRQIVVSPDSVGKEIEPSNLPAPGPEENGVTLAEWQTGIDLPNPVDFVEMSDVRRVVALPGKDFVIAGDGSGNLVQIKADERSPEDARPGGFENRIGGHEAAIVALAAATPADGSVVLASAAADGTVKAWRAEPKDDGQGGTVFAFDELAFRLFQPRAVWTSRPYRALPPRPFVSGLAVDGGLSRLAAVSGRRLGIVLLDLPSPNMTVVDASLNPRFAAFSPDGGTVAFEEAGTINLYSLRELELLGNLGGEGSSFVRAVFDPTGNRLAAASDDGNIAIYDVATREVARLFSATHLPIADVVFNAAGTLLMVGSRDGSLEVWNLETGESFDLSVDEEAGLSRVAFSPDGKRLLTLSRTGTFRSISARTLRGLNLNAAGVAGGAFSRNGSFLAVPVSGDAGLVINIIDTPTGMTVGAVSAGLKAFSYLGVSDDGRRVVVMTVDEVTVWARTDGPEEAVLAPTLPVAADGLRLSADGSTLLLREPSGVLHVARLVGDDALRLKTVPLPSPALEAELTADGSQIVAGGADAVIRVVPTNASATADAGFEVLGHGEIIHQMAISPDGQYLASASIDGRVRITDLERARWIASLPLAWLPSHPTPDRTRGKLLDPARCRSGFVRRLARPEDLVCVTPDSRARVAEENTTAASRIEPGGGAFGPNTCVSGFVWREAFEGDLVCVTPEIREFVREENRQGPSRRARFIQPAAAIEDPPAAAR